MADSKRELFELGTAPNRIAARLLSVAGVRPARTVVRNSGSGVGSFLLHPAFQRLPHVGSRRRNRLVAAFKNGHRLKPQKEFNCENPRLDIFNFKSPRSPLSDLATFFSAVSISTPNRHSPVMRVPYVPNPPQPANEEDEAIISRIAARRAPRPLQPLDLALLHSPPVADGWNSFLGAVRTRTSIPADLRELAISRVAVINRAWYEWMHHAPLAVAAGVSQEAMDWLQTQPGDLAGLGDGPNIFNEKQWAVLLLSDEMTRNVHVADETFNKVKALFSDKEVVEIVTTVKLSPDSSCPGENVLLLTVGNHKTDRMLQLRKPVPRCTGR